jgi:hypothetical protein
MCDPWLDGPAFDNGWDLLAKTRFRYEDFSRISHIWFSHEHPDHFSPPNIDRIPPDIRKNITILYQSSRDKKVVSFCRKKGFGNVVELEPGKWAPLLDDNFEILCEPHDNGDSWLAAHIDGQCILNINDCVITSEKECLRIARKTGPVDVLATQFSYANWVGNPGNTAAMAAAAAEKLSWVRTQIRTFRPRFVLPFASFTYFSHEDNYYLNQGMTRIQAAVDFIRKETDAIPVVLYPGDRWHPASPAPHDSAPALRRYLEDYARVEREGFIHRSSPVPIEKLLKDGATFVGKLRSKNGALIGLLPGATVFVEDHNQAFAFSSKGLIHSSREPQACDFICKSDALDYCFLSEWGARTLDINGRFRVPDNGKYWKFKTYATIANFNNRGEGLGEIFKTIQSRLAKKVTG